MKQSSIEILEQHKEHWHTLKNAGYIKSLEYPVKLEIQSVIQAELDPHYHENLWCGECVANMVRRAYTHYERYQESQQVSEVSSGTKTDQEVPSPAEPIIEPELIDAAKQAVEVLSEPVQDVSAPATEPVFEPLPEVTEENKSEVKTSKPSRKKSK